VNQKQPIFGIMDHGNAIKSFETSGNTHPTVQHHI